jgi:hypothetical protein
MLLRTVVLLILVPQPLRRIPAHLPLDPSIAPFSLFRKSQTCLGEVETADHDVHDTGGVEPGEGRVQPHYKRRTGATSGY